MATTDNKQKSAGEKKKTKRKSLTTWDGHPLSAQESNFIDEYCITGNGRQSYMTAYPTSNPNNAHQNSYRLLNKDYIASEINHRLQLAKEASIATATEIMNYFSAVMRGEIKDQFGLEAPLSERTKAAVELAKRQIDIPQKLPGNEQPEIKIVVDWARPITVDERPKTVRDVLGEGDMSDEEIAKYEGNSKAESTHSIN